MFSSTGLFKDVPCPLAANCLLVNCIFNHEYTRARTNTEAGLLYDPTAEDRQTSGRESLSPPPQKKRRIEANVKHEDVLTPKLEITTEGKNDISASKKPQKKALANDSAKPLKRLSDTISSDLTSIKQPVSPPTASRSREAPPAKTNANINKVPDSVLANRKQRPAESLVPRPMTKPPVLQAKRQTYLKALHKELMARNDEMVKGDDLHRQHTLSNDELVLMANDEEEFYALKSKGEDVYRQLVGQRIMQLKKLGVIEWKAFVLHKFKQEYMPETKTQTSKVETSKPEKDSAPLAAQLTAKAEIALLRKLRTPLDGLEGHGYVSNPPSDAEISKARQGVEASRGWEVCERCTTRFQVFPGRNEDGKLTTRGPCNFHLSKYPKRQRKKTDAIVGEAESLFDCCQSPPGSWPCQHADSHVFKVSDAERLASIAQYQRTPSSNEGREEAVAIDCEMGYTSHGMEMIRLSAVRWPSGGEVLDILVRPTGEIIDLNTIFSGVTMGHFLKAVPYGANEAKGGDDTSEDGELEQEPMRVVGSAALARDLLFGFVGPETLLIGHAINNDLDVLRILHPTVVDTVLLFPHPHGLPIRYSLQVLVRKHLGQDMRTADKGVGHDSKDDARATGDLVRWRVKEEWKQMQQTGWKIRHGELVPPDEKDDGLPSESRAVKGVLHLNPASL